MAKNLESIPEKTRWEMATRGLTAAYTAISKAFQQAAGQKKFEDFNGALWYEAGKSAKEFAKDQGLATANAADLEGAEARSMLS